MKPDITLKFLQRIGILKNLPGLNSLAQNCNDVYLSEGDLLFKEGQVGNTMYIIASGVLEIFKENRVIAQRTVGEHIGEMALLGNKIRSASARASSHVELIEINENIFMQYLSSNPEAFLPLFQTLSGRWKEDLENIDSDNLKLKRQIKLNEKFSRLLDDTVNEIFILERDTYRITQANTKTSQVRGYARDELCGTQFNDIFQNLSWNDLNDKFQKLINGKQAQLVFESQSIKKSGKTYPVEVRIQYLNLGDSPLIYAIVEDISDKKAMESHIKKLAFYDSLTGLPNRNLIKDRLNIMLSSAKRSDKKVAILHMGLDKFKEVNDYLGHAGGDQFLMQVAHRFDEALRKEDTFGRWGGDEFILLLPGLDDESYAAKMAQRAINIMERPVELLDKQFSLNFSIGIVFSPKDGVDIDSLFKHSDIAMYKAKESGGQTYRMYEESMNNEIIHRLNLEQDLKNAITNNEFEMYYQPKTSLYTGEIEGLEALIRWHRPKGKNVSPAEFIPLAEESRLIHKIGNWTFESVCKQIHEWHEKFGDCVRIGVNLSGKQFEQPNLIENFKSIIKSEKIDPKYLEIEVTETAVMTNVKQAIHILEQFKELGVRIALDDFGSGYTSLGYLKLLPIDTLKIDQSFVSNCMDNSNLAIIQGIIAISQKMGFKTIAEGVETKEQHDFLKKETCDQFQGYLCSKPLPAKEIEKLLYPG